MIYLNFFRKQIKTFTILCTVVTVVQLLIGFYGVTFVEDSNVLGCSPTGTQWLYVTQQGNLFTLMHMLVLLIQAAICKMVFYGIPKSYGMFELLKGDSQINQG